MAEDSYSRPERLRFTDRNGNEICVLSGSPSDIELMTAYNLLNEFYDRGNLTAGRYVSDVEMLFRRGLQRDAVDMGKLEEVTESLASAVSDGLMVDDSLGEENIRRDLGL